MSKACSICGEAIPEKRLQAVPNARTCVACQSKQERIESAAPKRALSGLLQADWSFLEIKEHIDQLPVGITKEPSLYETISQLEETEINGDPTQSIEVPDLASESSAGELRGTGGLQETTDSESAR